MSSADTDTAPPDTTDPDTTEAEATDSDALREGLLATVTALLGDDLVESHIDPGRQLYIRVTAESWKRAHKTLRDEAGFKFFEFLSAIDWMPSPFGKSEDATVDVGSLVSTIEDPGAVEAGHAGGDSRFQLLSRLMDITRGNLSVTIKTDVPDPRESDAPAVESLMGVFPGANWHERETHEMFGIVFAGHPYLQKLYLPTGFEGNPLRKDFPLLARQVKPWPGIVDVEPMPDEAETADAEEEGGDES